MAKTRVSLRIKFSLIIMIFSIGILLYNFIVTGISILPRNQSFLAEVMIQDTVKLLEYFSSTVNDGLIMDDDILLINTFDKIKNIDGIDYAVLFDRENGIRLHSETFAKKDAYLDDETFRSLRSRTNVTVSPEFDQRDIKSSYVLSRAFSDVKGKYNGLLMVKFSTGTLSFLIHKIRNIIIGNMIVILVTGIAVALLIGFIMATITLRPIRTMAKGMEIVGNGNLDYVIPIKRNDELGFLSDNFNKMTQQIKKAQKVIIEKKKEEEQMLIAQQIQESIFPEKPLIEPHYEIASFSVAAKVIGGDYHFYQKIDDNNAYFIVADISGKGVPAALITFMLSTVINVLITNERKPDAGYILTEANKIITDAMVKVERFATAMLCFYDDKSKTVNFVSAGHGDLYVYQSAQKRFAKASNIFLPVGIMDSVEFKAARIKLNPDDLVLIVTDGITDAKDEKKADFGTSRLLGSKHFQENMPVTDLIGKLKEDIFQFVGKAEQYDDMTMLLFKMKS